MSQKKADTSKSLGCFGLRYDLCKESRSAFHKNQMELSLFAANGGKQTDLVISMVDHDNQFIKTIIHVHVPEMRKMHKVVENIESEFEKGRKSNKDKDLFK